MGAGAKVAIGIPVLASPRDVHLRLCLASLRRYAGIAYDLFLQVDARNEAEASGFNPEWIRRAHPGVVVREVKGDGIKTHKQMLVDWLCSLEGYAAAFVLHADLFLLRAGVLGNMLECMLACGGVGSWWSVPLLVSGRVFAVRERAREEFLFAPRISTWLFCLDCGQYRGLRRRFSFMPGLFCGNVSYALDNMKNPLVRWVRGQPDFERYGDRFRKVFCDNGVFFRYAVEKLGIRHHSLGLADHPGFSSMELEYRPEGYVHAGQFTPDTFLNFYPEELYREREEMLRAILRREYGDAE